VRARGEGCSRPTGAPSQPKQAPRKEFARAHAALCIPSWAIDTTSLNRQHAGMPTRKMLRSRLCCNLIWAFILLNKNALEISVDENTMAQIQTDILKVWRPSKNYALTFKLESPELNVPCYWHFLKSRT
jgi:hypothetical protein